ncbi:MAG: hypothetical protein JWO94_2318 [Verrucomicrobiaceae bacterium]|nr:hypothetical protein [Verrucomicrobiaceae bacterium]
MKKWIWVGLAGVVLLWALGAVSVLPSAQARLETAATAELGKPEYTGAFDEVKVAFSGQNATLTGKVGSQKDHAQLATLIAEKIRTPGSSLNPVEEVTDHVGVAYELSRLHPTPWLLIARYAGQGIVGGVVPSDLKDKAARVLSDKLAGAKITSSLNATLDREGKPRPPADAGASLDAKAVPALADGEIAVSALDGRWTSMKASIQDTEVSNAIGIDSSAIIETLAPLRAMQAAEAEKVRQATLPPAYGAVAALPGSLHIFGLTGDGESQRNLLTSLSTAYPKRKILTSAIKTSSDIRPGSDWAAALASLPKGDNDAFVAALPSGNKAVVFTGKDDEAAMEKALGSILPPSFNFSALWDPYASWLKAKEAPPVPKLLPPPSQPPVKLAPPPAPPATPVPPPSAPTPPPPSSPAPSPAPASTTSPAPAAPAAAPAATPPPAVPPVKTNPPQ